MADIDTPKVDVKKLNARATQATMDLQLSHRGKLSALMVQ